MKEPRPCGPILVANLLWPLELKLLELLRSLNPSEWDLPTIVPNWRVRDIVAHMLDTHLRKLAMVRDGYFSESPESKSFADVVDLVNRMNREGVHYCRRLSAPVVISLLEVAARESCAMHESLDPFAVAKFSVSWAGETESLNWFDTAREMTERWHHQQQIRLATSRHGAETREFYYPVLDCFLRGLPFAYRGASAQAGTVVRVEVTGESGGLWNLFRRDSGWMLTFDELENPSATITIPQSIAWRLFTKGISREQARDQVTMSGDEHLGQVLLGHLAIVG